MSPTSSGARNFASCPGSAHSTPLGLAFADETFAISREVPIPIEQLSCVSVFISSCSDAQRAAPGHGAARSPSCRDRPHRPMPSRPAERNVRAPHAPPGIFAIAFGMSVHKNSLRTKLRRGPQRHGGVHAEIARRIRCRRNHSALIALSADNHRLALQRRIVELLHRHKEGVHINVEDGAKGAAHRNRNALQQCIAKGLGHEFRSCTPKWTWGIKTGWQINPYFRRTLSLH